ncbi:MAG: glycerate kinase [Methylococcaceae bacterium]|nr:glycerate kinase [Methylococcaceae bacterium]MCI0732586.1 glycerate kinase [Methylococcaceae bacterium]
MKIVIATDSFKENMTSLEVATAIEKGIREVIPDATCIKVPMADGGEGTVQALVDATSGRIVTKTVVGPLGERVEARYGFLGDGHSAVIEMAEASGLPLVPKAKRDPLRTTTYGTGQLILDALDSGATEIIIGIGGSSTNDCGSGMAQALGVRYLDKNGVELSQYASGGMLDQIAEIDTSGLDSRLRDVRIQVACDVDNPLCGERGASAVFGPQKGATPEMVKTLDSNLGYFADLIRSSLGIDVRELKGAGASGGLGAGLVAFCGATLKSGIDIVVEATGLEQALQGAHLAITGEGKVDFQTAFGKTPSGVARAAKKTNTPVVAIGGALADDARGVFQHGIDGLESAAARDMSLEEAIRNSRMHLQFAGERLARLLLIGRRIERKLSGRE